jgi:hypothetical protein
MIKYFKLYDTDWYVVGGLPFTYLLTHWSEMQSVRDYLALIPFFIVGYFACIIYNALYRHRRKQ